MPLSRAASLVLVSVVLAAHARSSDRAAKEEGASVIAAVLDDSAQEPPPNPLGAGFEVVGSAVHHFGDAFRGDVLRHGFQLRVTGDRNVRIDTISPT